MIQVFMICSAAAAMAQITPPAEGALLMGAVKRPGLISISGPQGLHDAIKKSGGLRLDADRRKVKIVARDGSVRTVDMTALGTVPAIHAGDRITVPAIDPTTSILVQGGVEKAGVFDFKPGMTVQDVLRDAKPSPLASLDSVKVMRARPDGTIQIDTKNLLAMNLSPATLRAGDTVVVPFGKKQDSDKKLLTYVLIGVLLIVLIN